MRKKTTKSNVSKTALKRAARTAPKKAAKTASKQIYKTQGSIASVSMGSNETISFTINPIEPYDFPVKEDGETKQYILFQPVSEETRNKGAEKDKSACLKEKCWKVSFAAEFLVPAKAKRTGLGMSFGDILLLKQNRSKVELAVEETEFAKTANGSSINEASTQSSGCSLKILKMTVK